MILVAGKQQRRQRRRDPMTRCDGSRGRCSRKRQRCEWTVAAVAAAHAADADAALNPTGDQYYAPHRCGGVPSESFLSKEIVLVFFLLHFGHKTTTLFYAPSFLPLRSTDRKKKDRTRTNDRCDGLACFSIHSTPSDFAARPAPKSRRSARPPHQTGPKTHTGQTMVKPFNEWCLSSLPGDMRELPIFFLNITSLNGSILKVVDL
jgi:hypothetical protein